MTVEPFKPNHGIQNLPAMVVVVLGVEEAVSLFLEVMRDLVTLVEAEDVI